MDDRDFVELIKGAIKLDKGKGEEPSNFAGVIETWAELWRKHLRQSFDLKERSLHRKRGFELFINHAYPEIAAVQASRSIRSYGGRHKIDAPPTAFAAIGDVRVPFGKDAAASDDESHPKKRAKIAVADDDTLVDPSEYMLPPGLVMGQPNMMSGRTPTVSFGPAVNPEKCPPPPLVSKTTGWQTIDKARVSKWARQDRKTYQQQKTIMGASALEAATCAKLQVMLRDGRPQQWEWLHLCAFKMGGINGNPQTASNLVAGTYDCNTAMITLEDAIKRLANDHGMVFEVCVTATTYPGTHVAMQIDYEVTCNGKATTTYFYPMSTVDVMRGEIRVAVETLRTYFNDPEPPNGKRKRD